MISPLRFVAPLFTALLLAAPSLVLAEAIPGKPAPDFTLPDASGQQQTLKDFRGQWVVLEWFNKDCPFVKKHYGSNNMQKLQQTYTDKKVVWLSIASSAVGKQGHMTPAEALEVAKERGAHTTKPILLDPAGTVGKLYGAKTTPHMFIIDPQGTIVYAGAIDDNDSANPAVIPTSANYVATTLDRVLGGESVTPFGTKPYGCSVKY